MLVNLVKIQLKVRCTPLGFPNLKSESDKVQYVLYALAYDFNEFELSHFVKHIGIYREKPIQLVPFPFTPTLFGVWVLAEMRDYIFYNACVQPIHQTHIILHEIAHMLLNHQRRRIDDVLPSELLRELGANGAMGRLRIAPTSDIHADEEEQESERFVYLIQRQLMRANRLAELTAESSSIPRLKPITDAMGYTDS